MSSPYSELRRFATEESSWAWLLPLLDESDRIISDGRHGDLPRWQSVLKSLPVSENYFDGEPAAPVFGPETENPRALATQLNELHPWRKGPLKIGGISIDTEWRSDWKWDRISPHLDLTGHRVLDVGCGNGYYGWRMLQKGAERVIGIDPTLVYVMQWQACKHFSGPQPNDVLPLGIEDLPTDAGGFDTVVSMGVLYHRRDPVAHLRHLKSLLIPGGQLVLETLVLEEEEDTELVPEKRYARMRNVWSVPSLSRLNSWISGAGLRAVRVMDVIRTSQEEQRSTEWMRFESLKECLDPDDSTLTVEGHPAPVRAAILIDQV